MADMPKEARRMYWWNRRMCAFDIETTGVDVEEDRIVSASVVLVGDKQPTEAHDWLVNPGVPIPEAASEVHKITTERVEAEGVEPAAMLDAVTELLAAATRRNLPLIAFNAPFDFTILDRECRRHGLTDPWERCYVDGGRYPYVVDPLVIDKHLDRYRKGSRKLDAICDNYGAVLDAAHTSGDDALAAARAAWVLMEKGEVKRRVRNAEEGREKARLKRKWESVRFNLPLLHAAQCGWAREQAVGLREYFQGKGQVDDARGVREDWPMIPATTVF